MNDYLVTYDGGQDVWADDLSFMQNSLKSMIDTAVRTYGDNCILWGCLDSAKENVVEGGVVISGKLYQVPALGAIGSNKLCFREVLSDERTFENQQVHKVKKQYEAYLSTDTSGSVANIDLKTAVNAKEKIETLSSDLSDLKSKYSSLEEKVPESFESSYGSEISPDEKYITYGILESLDPLDLIHIVSQIDFGDSELLLDCTIPADKTEYIIYLGTKKLGVSYDDTEIEIRVKDYNSSTSFTSGYAKIAIIKGA